MLCSEQVSDAVKRGVNQKIADGRNLYLVVKNGKGFWVYQFRDGNAIRSKGLGSAARVTPVQARRAREAFAVARRDGLELAGFRGYTPRGDRFAVAADAYLANHADEWGERHRAGHDALSMREHGATLHGFRSTLSTWAEKQDDGRAYPRAVIKAVLAHGKGDAVTAAYLRSSLFEARRKLMEHWSRFATGNHVTGTTGASA